jgi:hypothetical protein
MESVDRHLHELIPSFDRRELHRLTVDSLPEDILWAAETVTWRDVPAFRAMVWTAGLGRTPFPPDGRVLDMFLGNGFAVLRRDEAELVIGGIERISRTQPVVPLDEATAAETFRAFETPGHLKVAFDFRCADGELSTETRVLATSAAARRMFSAYWFAIRGGSGLIRHIWLRGIRRRAATRLARRIHP